MSTVVYKTKNQCYYQLFGYYNMNLWIKLTCKLQCVCVWICLGGKGNHVGLIGVKKSNGGDKYVISLNLRSSLSYKLWWPLTIRFACICHHHKQHSYNNNNVDVLSRSANWFCFAFSFTVYQKDTVECMNSIYVLWA